MTVITRDDPACAGTVGYLIGIQWTIQRPGGNDVYTKSYCHFQGAVPPGLVLTDTILSDELPMDMTGYSVATVAPAVVPGCLRTPDEVGNVCFFDDFGSIGSVNSTNPPACVDGGTIANGTAIPNADVRVIVEW